MNTIQYYHSPRSQEISSISGFLRLLLQANDHKISRTLSVVKNWFNPAPFDNILLTKVNPTINCNNTFHNFGAEGHKTPYDAEILLGKGPISLIFINDFVRKVF